MGNCRSFSLKKLKYSLRVQVGRWQEPDDFVTVEDLNDDTLIALAVAKVKSRQYSLGATQVLIWDADGRSHNLIAVYGIDNGKLTVL